MSYRSTGIDAVILMMGLLITTGSIHAENTKDRCNDAMPAAVPALRREASLMPATRLPSGIVHGAGTRQPTTPSMVDVIDTLVTNMYADDTLRMPASVWREERYPWAQYTVVPIAPRLDE